MKILVFGRGAVGTQYGWAFENAGHAVEFYVRPGRKAQYSPYADLEIMDARRDKKNRKVKERWPLVLHEEIMENYDYGLIFVSVNAEQIPGVVQYLVPRVGKATVLFIGNFWKDIRNAAHPLPRGQVVWGFPGCGGGFEGNTVYGALYKTVHVGVMASEPTAREQEVRRLFQGAGFTVEMEKGFQDWLRNHFVSNTAMEIEVIKSGSFKNAASSKEALAGIARNTKEMIPVLKAAGVKPDASTRLIGSVSPGVFGFLLQKAVFTPGSFPFAAVEHNHYPVGPAVREMASQARKYGIDAPRLYEAESLIQG